MSHFNNNEKRLITEDDIIDWVDRERGLLITRKLINVNTDINISNIKLVCLTGYDNIILNFFNQLLNKITNKIVLIIIETDCFDLKPEYLNNEKIKKIFCWNKPYEHQKVSAIPIGLNYGRQYNELSEWLKTNREKTDQEFVRDSLLCVNCSPNTNSIRGKLVEKAKKDWKDFCKVIEFIPNKNTYWKPSYIEGKIRVDVTNPLCYDMMSKYKFILSPPGAGLDCHRTWEALYTGCIPIVLKTSISELYEDLPVLVVTDWGDISQSFLEKAYIDIKKKKRENKYNMDKLYLDFWLKTFNDMTTDIGGKSIHFITYGNDKFKQAKKRILDEANKFGEFKTIFGYGPENLPEFFYKKYKSLLDNSRGGGYWIWRPMIIHDALQKINDNDFLVYLDAGCSINPKGKKRFNEYIELLDNNEHNYGILSFQMSGNTGPGNLEKEKWWTTKQIFDYFKVEPESEIGNTGQYLGGILVMKKNKHLMDYMREYINIILKDPILCSDEFNKTPQHVGFKENRHEQSITSILRKKMGSVVIDGDESFMQPFGEGYSLKYPFWAKRSRN